MQSRVLSDLDAGQPLLSQAFHSPTTALSSFVTRVSIELIMNDKCLRRLTSKSLEIQVIRVLWLAIVFELFLELFIDFFTHFVCGDDLCAGIFENRRELTKDSLADFSVAEARHDFVARSQVEDNQVRVCAFDTASFDGFIDITSPSTTNNNYKTSKGLFTYSDPISSMYGLFKITSASVTINSSASAA